MIVRRLGLRPYEAVWQAMQRFSEERNGQTEDELWLVEHPPIYTQGLAGKAEHLLNLDQIQVVRVDRGGQITYHGPGQVVMYLLLDIKRRRIGIRSLVTMIEQSIIKLLALYNITAISRADAPGVYTHQGAKIASLGLKVRKGCTYHGLALNVSMDLTPFSGINPCGLIGMRMTQMADFVDHIDPEQVGRELAEIFTRHWQEEKPSASVISGL
ncbi:MAG: octanoyltransferase [Cardiobacteriales bacterium]|nr:MAG: octanoyltransferase [Cardiobacteriales bacterium]